MSVDSTLEYQSLRNGMIQTQGRRFFVLGLTVFSIPIFLFLECIYSRDLSWTLASMPILTLLTLSCYLTSFLSKRIFRTGTYIQVFLDSKWENRLFFFMNDDNYKTLSWELPFTYIFLILISIGISILLCESIPSSGEILMFIFVCSAFLFTLIKLIKVTTMRFEYKKIWENIQKIETTT